MMLIFPRIGTINLCMHANIFNTLLIEILNQNTVKLWKMHEFRQVEHIVCHLIGNWRKWNKTYLISNLVQ